MEWMQLTKKQQEKYSRMWTSERDQWILKKTLLRLRELPPREHLLIFNRADRTALLVEDNQLHDILVQHMLAAGIPVLEVLP